MTQTVVQSTNGSLGGVDGLNLTLNGVTAHNALEIRIASYFGSNTPAATTVSGGGLTWVRAAGQDSSLAQGVRAEIWYAEDVPAGNYTITIDCGATPGNNYGRIWMGEIAGRALSGSHDSAANGGATNTSNSPAVTGAGSSTQANVMVVGVLSADGGFSNLGIDAANGSGLTWTNRLVDQDPNTEMGGSFDDAPATATLTPSVNWGTMSTSSSKWAAVVAVFKDAGAGSSELDLDATESPDVFAGALNLDVSIALAVTEAPDVFAGSLNLDVGLVLAVTEAPDVFAGTLDVVGAASTLDLAATEAPDVFAGTLELPGLSTLALAATEAPDVFSGTLVGPDVPDEGVLAPKFQGLRYPNVTRQWVGGKKKREPEPQVDEVEIEVPAVEAAPLEPVGAALGIVVPQFVPLVPLVPQFEPATAPPVAEPVAPVSLQGPSVAAEVGGATTIEPIPPAVDYARLAELEQIRRHVDRTIGMQASQIRLLEKEVQFGAAELARTEETIQDMQKAIADLRKQLRNQTAALLAVQMLESEPE